jgi:RHS repeat-associated protein
MTQSKPVDQKNPTRQRVVLLATNSSQSIIGEIVDGETNSIGYSAYGKQSAQQEVATRLGFNGQLRESGIGWYMLGNGYRAYNPRLMRFHSPDSWSPFSGGGLNAYMYCVGDPVNRADPTGHITVSKFFSNLIGFLFGGADYTCSRGLVPGPDAMTAVTGPMKPAKDGAFDAMVNVGASVAVRAPQPRTGSSPASTATGSTTPYGPDAFQHGVVPADNVNHNFKFSGNINRKDKTTPNYNAGSAAISKALQSPESSTGPQLKDLYVPRSHHDSTTTRTYRIVKDYQANYYSMNKRAPDAPPSYDELMLNREIRS